MNDQAAAPDDGRDPSKWMILGSVMMAFAVLTFFIGPISGSLSDRIGSRGLAFCGMSIHAVGLVLLSRLDAGFGNFDVAWRLAVCGCGAGMFQSPINSAAMGSAPPRFRGVASSILAVMRNTGMAFGIAVAGAIVYNLAPFTTSGRAGPFTGQGGRLSIQRKSKISATAQRDRLKAEGFSDKSCIDHPKRRALRWQRN